MNGEIKTLSNDMVFFDMYRLQPDIKLAPSEVPNTLDVIHGKF